MRTSALHFPGARTSPSAATPNPRAALNLSALLSTDRPLSMNCPPPPEPGSGTGILPVRWHRQTRAGLTPNGRLTRQAGRLSHYGVGAAVRRFKARTVGWENSHPALSPVGGEGGVSPGEGAVGQVPGPAARPMWEVEALPEPERRRPRRLWANTGRSSPGRRDGSASQIGHAKPARTPALRPVRGFNARTAFRAILSPGGGEGGRRPGEGAPRHKELQENRGRVRGGQRPPLFGNRSSLAPPGSMNRNDAGGRGAHAARVPTLPARTLWCREEGEPSFRRDA